MSDLDDKTESALKEVLEKEAKRDKKTGRFVKGVSGNPNGRRKGSRGKRMTDAQLKEYLGKKTESWLREIEGLAQVNINSDPGLSFKCYQALLKADFDMRMADLKKELKNNPPKEKPIEATYHRPKVLNIAKKQ